MRRPSVKMESMCVGNGNGLDMYAKISPTMVNARDIAGMQKKKKKKYYDKRFLLSPLEI